MNTTARVSLLSFAVGLGVAYMFIGIPETQLQAWLFGGTVLLITGPFYAEFIKIKAHERILDDSDERRNQR